MSILGISLTIFIVFLVAGHFISKTCSGRKKELIFFIAVVLGALVSAVVGALLTWQNILKVLAL